MLDALDAFPQKLTALKASATLHLRGEVQNVQIRMPS